MVFDTERNFMNFATTRGLYYTWVHCALYAKRKVGTSTDRLYTAIGARPFDQMEQAYLRCAVLGYRARPGLFHQGAKPQLVGSF